ncbi:TPA: SpaA isopeptide-forming pilin-related protein [Enterococcus faecium]
MKRNKIKQVVGFLMLLLTVIQSFLEGTIVSADESEVSPQFVEGETGTVSYNEDEVYTLHGTKHGAAWSDITSTMILQADSGQTEVVFCIEPGIPLAGVETPDYEAIPRGDIDHRAQVAATIWPTVFPNQTVEEQITTQAVIWENLSAYGLTIASIDGISNFAELKATLNQAIDDYDRKPDFHNQTIPLKFGQTNELHSGGVSLNLFDTVTENSANVDYHISEDGQVLSVTPTDSTQQTGSFAAKSSYMEGTPIAWEKEGSQTVMVARIQQTNHYQVNFDIETVGDIQIQKVDKTSGEPIAGTKFEVEMNGEIQEVETDEHGQATIENIQEGTQIKATEVFVPEPYVLGSAIGESDVLEGTVVAGETLTLTQQNTKAVGQIIIEKSVAEADTALGNENYTLAGNVFEIRKETEDGEVIQEVTTDEKGIASTDATLPLGIYVVIETHASEGLRKSFEPVTVTIDYEGQTEAIVVGYAKGTNNVVKTPLIQTLATVNGEKTFELSKETPMHDQISLSDLYEGELYKNKIKLWRIQDDDYTNAQVVFETEEDFAAEAENMEQVVETLVDTTKDNEQTKYVFTEELFDENGEKVAEHTDLKNEDQTIRPIFSKTPEIPETPKEEQPKKPQQPLPKTAGSLMNRGLWFGLGIIFALSLGVWFYRKKQTKK